MSDRESRSQQREWREQHQSRESAGDRREKHVDTERTPKDGLSREDQSEVSTAGKSESGGDGAARDDGRGELSSNSNKERSGDDREGEDRGENRDEDRLDDRVKASARIARMELDRDVQGRERRRDEVLLVGNRESIAAIRAAGFTVLAQRSLPSLKESLARIRVRSGSSIEQLIAELRALAPEASIAPNHIFRPSAATSSPRPSATVLAPMGQPDGAVIGVIDTGLDTTGSLQSRVVAAQGFADAGYLPRAHGTLVAQIAASAGARLVSADVFGVDADNRLVASAEAIASAIDWLVGRHVRVINISIEGPENLVLERVIRVALAAKVAIVAAAGNSGPAAPPAYPAAYEGVLAVTAIDEADRVYRRANQGDYISFAARGVHVPVDDGVAGARTVSGTSFAAPVVAAEIARRLSATRHAQLGDVIVSLERDAHDLGAAGRDAVYGWGKIEVTQPLTAESH